MRVMSLSENVFKALDFFIKNKPPKINLDNISLPFIIGSGNAYTTGLMLFAGKAAIFADESNFKFLIKAYQKVINKGLISNAIIISASGEKDSVWEIETAHKYKLNTILLTAQKKSSAAQIADKVYVFDSIEEPYTYNVSTYLGMILAVTKENPSFIKDFLSKLKLPSDFQKYKAYAFILPDKFMQICSMLDIKKSELFGPHLTVRSFSCGHARHAKFVHRWQQELIVSLANNVENFGYPENRFLIKIPETFGFGGIMALCYHILGKIQEIKAPFFAKNLEKYCSDYGPKAYSSNKPFSLIVPGSI